MNLQEKQFGLQLNGTHQLLVYVDVNLLGMDINTTKKKKLLDTSKEVGLKVNIEKTKHMFILCQQITGQYLNIMITNKKKTNSRALVRQRTIPTE
jgi:chaperonin GroEL (HSP60 family)